MFYKVQYEYSDAKTGYLIEYEVVDGFPDECDGSDVDFRYIGDNRVVINTDAYELDDPDPELEVPMVDQVYSQLMLETFISKL
jgi:hypothetical protein